MSKLTIDQLMILATWLGFPSIYLFEAEMVEIEGNAMNMDEIEDYLRSRI